MLSRGVLIAAAAAALGAGLVIRFPAGIALGWLAPQELKPSGLSGTAWRGEAASLNYQGIELAPFRWQLKPLSFLRGRFGAEIEALAPDLNARASVSVSPGGTIRATGARVLARLDRFTANSPIGPVLGQLDANIQELVVVEQFPVRLLGTIDLTALQYPPIGTLPLGDYRLTYVEPPDDAVHCEIRDLGGPLEVAGSLILQPDASYELSGNVKSRRGASPELVNGLRYLGRPDAEGRYALDQRGNLRQ